MSPKSRKKLIEHSMPLEAINAASSREKSIRHGHPSTLHLWWARRPLAACRAVLFAQLVDDPSAWTDRFPEEEAQDKERRRLHKIIEDMVEWPRSDARDQKRFERAIQAAQYEIARSVAWGLGEEPPEEPKAVLAYLQEKAPPVYDPFCGGGSIPIEAQRLGLPAYGSDLNPVAVLLTKALIEFPSKFTDLAPVHPDVKMERDLGGREWTGAQGLAEDVRRYGLWMQNEAKQTIGEHYPPVKLPDGSEANVIAWLWARTVASPDPAQKGAHVPLVSSFVISSRSGNEAVVVPIKDVNAQDGWRFTVKNSGVTKQDITSALNGTKPGRGSTFVCFLSGATIEADYVKAQCRSGKMTARLMAVVAEGKRGRVYLEPNNTHEAAADMDAPVVPEISQDMPKNPRWFSPPDYGMPQFSDLYTSRQLLLLTTFSDLIGRVRERVREDSTKVAHFGNCSDSAKGLADGGTGAAAYADAVATYLAFAVSKMSNLGSSITSWMSDRGAFRETFARQAIPMVWDFAEANFFANTGASFDTVIDKVSKAIAEAPCGSGSAQLVDAPENNYPIKLTVISTDPPYYDNIGYADLSDYFYVWLRRSLKQLHPELFRRLTTPKSEELVAIPLRHGGKSGAEKHFMEGMFDALMAMRKTSTDGPLAIYYAFKQSEVRDDGVLSPGWAAFLQAIVNAGLQVVGTWPIRTESSGRIVANGTNALASSVVLVCLVRPEQASTINRREFLKELKPAIKKAIEDHQHAGVPLPDRRQAAIGPGIGIFSKHTAIRETDDSEMSVATALALINSEIDEALSEGSEALDPETRFALEWFAIHGYRLVPGGAGTAISMLQSLNLAESRMNASGLFRSRAGDAKILTRDEMHESDPNWRPSGDDIFTVWEMSQHLARTFHAEEGGVDAAGRILAESRGSGPDVLLVAERLFEIATNNGYSDEALIWNQLQTAWPEIERAADRAEEAGIGSDPVQGELL